MLGVQSQEGLCLVEGLRNGWCSRWDLAAPGRIGTTFPGRSGVGRARQVDGAGGIKSQGQSESLVASVLCRTESGRLGGERRVVGSPVCQAESLALGSHALLAGLRPACFIPVPPTPLIPAAQDILCHLDSQSPKHFSLCLSHTASSRGKCFLSLPPGEFFLILQDPAQIPPPPCSLL